MTFEPTIFVVNGDVAVRNALAGVAKLLGRPCELCTTASEFLASYDRSRAGCLILDYKLGEQSGLELQRRLTQLGYLLPVIMISSHVTVRTVVEAMQNGALSVLETPFALDELCQLIKQAFELDAVRRVEVAERDEAMKLLATLTRKEHEVFNMVAEGMSNKEMARKLDLSVRAVEDRRSRMMRKLDFDYLSDVIQLKSKVRRPFALFQPSLPAQICPPDHERLEVGKPVR
jgi:FixJ family two-component response regulator